MKRFLSALFAVFMLISVNSMAFAEDSRDTDDSYQQYCELQADGILGKDISFEEWLYIIEKSEALEKMLEESDEFVCVYDSMDAQAVAAYTVQVGDIYVTNGTSSSGLLGHAGISVSKYFLLHIAGPGLNPTLITPRKWDSDYTSKGWTKVYRHIDSDIAYDAGMWASDTYEINHSDAVYEINKKWDDFETTYCSKIVWQAYYYARDPEHYADVPSLGFILPYDLPNLIHDVSLETTLE